MKILMILNNELQGIVPVMIKIYWIKTFIHGKLCGERQKSDSMPQFYIQPNI